MNLHANLPPDVAAAAAALVTAALAWLVRLLEKAGFEKRIRKEEREGRQSSRP